MITEHSQGRWKEVYYKEKYKNKDGIDFLKKAGVKIEQFKMESQH